MKYIVTFILLVVISIPSFAQVALTSSKVNGFNVLVSASKHSTDSISTIYTAAFSGVSINGRTVAIAMLVTDTASAGSTGYATVDVDLQGSLDGTNFFTVSAAVINDNVFSGPTYATPSAATVALTSWDLPWYRLAVIPTGNLGNTHAQYTDGKFKLYIGGVR